MTLDASASPASPIGIDDALDAARAACEAMQRPSGSAAADLEEDPFGGTVTSDSPIASGLPSVDRIKSGHARVTRALVRLQSISEESPRRARNFIGQLLQSSDWPLYAYWETARTRRTGCFHAFWNSVMAGGFTPVRRSGKPINVFSRRKPDGGNRIVTKSSDADHAHQVIVADLLLAHLGARTVSQASPRDVFDDIMLMDDAGFRYGVVGDFADCHMSLDPRRLLRISALPRPLVEQVTFPEPSDPCLVWPKDPAQRRRVRETVYRRGYRPLMPGTAAANAVAAVMLSDLLLRCASGAPLVLYGDDFVVFAPTEAEASHLRRAIGQTTETTTYGRIGFGRLDLFDMRDGVDILGMRLWDDRGCLRICLSAKGRRRLAFKLADRLKHDRDAATMETYLQNWRGQYGSWKGAERFASRVAACIKPYLGAPNGGDLDPVIQAAVDAAPSCDPDNHFVPSGWYAEKWEHLARYGAPMTPYELRMMRSAAGSWPEDAA